MSVRIKNDNYKRVSELDFGEPFICFGLLYVKSVPAGSIEKRYNCIGVGHDGRVYLWDELVQPVEIEVTVL